MIGDGLGRLSETLDLVAPVRGLEVRQVVAGLPGFAEAGQQVQVVRDRLFDRPDHIQVLRHRVTPAMGLAGPIHDVRHSGRRFTGTRSVRPRGGFRPRVIEENALGAVFQQHQLEEPGMAFEERRFARSQI